MAVATLRRLPGFAFEARTPPLEEVTPGHWVACQVRTGVAHA